MIKLENPWLKLTVEPEQGYFSLTNLENEFTWVRNARSGLKIRIGSRCYSWWTEELPLILVRGPIPTETLHGLLDLIEMTFQTRTGAFDLTLRLGLLREQPLMLQQMALTNRDNLPVFPNQLTFCDLPPGGIHLNQKPGIQPVFFSNGWQSWSPSRIYRLGERQQRSRLGLLSNPMILNPGTPVPKEKNHFASDMFALLGDLDTRAGLVAGFLSQNQQFGSLETRFSPQPTLAMWANADNAELPSGQTMQTDWAAYAFISLNDPHPFQTYFEAVKRENRVRLPERTPLGWCSWYYYFEKVTAQDIRQNLEKVNRMRSELPLDLVQIDDGFEQSVGNWLEFNGKFPAGVQPLAKEIQAASLSPGIWLAPFIVQAGSPMIKRHPDWLLRNKLGRPVNAGFAWNNLATALDLTQPEALAYVQTVIRTAVQEWGFPYLKLDFLYAAALGGRYHDPTQTRAQVLRKGLEIIRQEAGQEAVLLGCGCPLGPALGIVDLMRISEDVGPTWAPEFNQISRPFKQEPSMPCARNAIQNILARSEMNCYWWGNDPDCLLVRPDSQLTLAEVQSLATIIGITGGALLISDDLTKLPEERLRIAQSLIPIIPSNPQILDRFERSIPSQVKQVLHNATGEYPLLAFFNWEDHPADLTIRLDGWRLPASQAWIAREYWSGKIFTATEEIRIDNLPAHGVCLLALHPLENQPVYLGSDLHFSQGIEVKSWHRDAEVLSFRLDFTRKVQGRIYLYCPQNPIQVLQDGRDVCWSILEGSILEIPLVSSGRTNFEFKFS